MGDKKTKVQIKQKQKAMRQYPPLSPHPHTDMDQPPPTYPILPWLCTDANKDLNNT